MSIFEGIKNWIDKNQLEIKLNTFESYAKGSGIIKAEIHILSSKELLVTSWEIKLVEKYSRGRGKDAKTDFYQLGKLQENKAILISSNVLKEIPVSISFQYQHTPIERWESNPVGRGISFLLKTLKQVDSTFELELRLSIEGYKADYTLKKKIKLT